MFIHFPIFKNHHLEFGLFSKFYSDSLFVFTCDLTMDKKIDHAPKFELLFAIKNIKVVEFNVYNIHHANSEEDKPHKHIVTEETNHE